ncbi:MAG: hypothetical protein P8X57_16080, partial [Cyclobacteriaceae bacterium]
MNYQLEQYKEAYEAFKNAETGDPIPNELAYAYAKAAFHQDQFAKVLTLLGGSDEQDAPRMKTIAHFNLKQYENAFTMAQKANRDHEISRIGGLSAYHSGNYSAAISWLEEAEPDKEIMTALAKSAMAEKDNGRAEQYLTWLISTGFDQAEYFVKRAEIRLPEDRNAAISDLEE